MAPNTIETLTSDPRITVRRGGAPDPEGRCVVYWMQRSQRGVDNHALNAAIHAGNLLGKPVAVFFAPVPFYPNANLRHYAFLEQGVLDLREAVERRGCGFVLRRFPEHSLEKFLGEVQPALLVGDENPLREPEHWRQKVATRVNIPFWTVDADVVVPAKLMEKKMYAAYVIRPRLLRELDRFLVPFENPRAKVKWQAPAGLHSMADGADLTAGWNIDRSVAPVSTFRGGTKEALRLLREFVENKLDGYGEKRNHPELDFTSRLSPYLHFGHIGPVTIALAARQSAAPAKEIESLINELVVWRELAVNFVRFDPHYDTIECAEPWAKKDMAEHASDPRERRYSGAQLEAAATHDPLWNAAQKQMVVGGWMHNYMRMYWAKKILEWSPSAAQAYQTAVRLNDKYELDGRDPNGYAGVAWSIVGKFDRPWFTRPVFGKVRFMSGAAAAKKFDAKKYIEQVAALGSAQRGLW